MNFGKYLERIAFTRQVIPDLSTLYYLQRQHLFHIPFENCDIYNGTPIILDNELFYHKVITAHRGGYCYELNTLFYHLLKYIGFDVAMIQGRVASNHKEFGPQYGHMALMVTIDNEKWLVDVGFGDFSMKPMKIATDLVQGDGRNYYVITKQQYNGKDCYCVGKRGEEQGQYIPQYMFTLAPCILDDFEEMNHFHQTSPNSYFLPSLMCSLPTGTGRISVINNKLIETVHGKKTTKTIQGVAHRNFLLKKHFDIVNLRQREPATP